MTPKYAVKFDNLEFGWHSQIPILTIDDWAIETGKRVFLQGSSGSGKSTLLNIIAGSSRFWYAIKYIKTI